MNLIQVAAKYKYFNIVEMLMKAGVQCPPEIKRKIERNNNQSAPSKPSYTRSTREKKVVEEPVFEEVVVEEKPEKVSTILKVSDGNFGDQKAIIDSLT